MNKVIMVEDRLTLKDGARIVREVAEASCDNKVETIVLFIHSGGGDPTIILSIWDALKNSGKKVASIGMYTVGSTASAIFMMAERRILYPYTGFLLHEASFTPSKESQWYKKKIEYLIKGVENDTKILLAPVIENSSMPEEFLNEKVSQGDWWLTEEEMKEYRIITEEYDVQEVLKLLGDV